MEESNPSGGERSKGQRESVSSRSKRKRVPDARKSATAKRKIVVAESCDHEVEANGTVTSVSNGVNKRGPEPTSTNQSRSRDRVASVSKRASGARSISKEVSSEPACTENGANQDVIPPTEFSPTNNELSSVKIQRSMSAGSTSISSEAEAVILGVNGGLILSFLVMSILLVFAYVSQGQQLDLLNRASSVLSDSRSLSSFDLIKEYDELKIKSKDAITQLQKDLASLKKENENLAKLLNTKVKHISNKEGSNITTQSDGMEL